MTEGDFQAFKRIQKAYFKRVCESKSSLLARIYGIYSVQMEDQEPVKLVVMGNSMKGAKSVKGVFDLKGSMVNRRVKGKNFKPTQTLKDKNLLEMSRRNIWLRFRPEDQKKIQKTLKHDVSILRQFNLMDYSLLLCIQENPAYENLRSGFAKNNPNRASSGSGASGTSFNSIDTDVVDFRALLHQKFDTE